MRKEIQSLYTIALHVEGQIGVSCSKNAQITQTTQQLQVLKKKLTQPGKEDLSECSLGQFSFSILKIGCNDMCTCCR